MPESTHIESDLHCIRCGHNLRTLAWAAKCGECGEAVDATRIESERACTHPQWRSRIHMALLVLLTGVFLDVIAESSYFKMTGRSMFGNDMLGYDWILMRFRTVYWGVAIFPVLYLLWRVPCRRSLLFMLATALLLSFGAFVLLYEIGHGMGPFMDRLFAGTDHDGMIIVEQYVIPLLALGHYGLRSLIPILATLLSWHHTRDRLHAWATTLLIVAVVAALFEIAISLKYILEWTFYWDFQNTSSWDWLKSANSFFELLTVIVMGVLAAGFRPARRSRSVSM